MQRGNGGGTLYNDTAAEWKLSEYELQRTPHTTITDDRIVELPMQVCIGNLHLLPPTHLCVSTAIVSWFMQLMRSGVGSCDVLYCGILFELDECSTYDERHDLMFTFFLRSESVTHHWSTHNDIRTHTQHTHFLCDVVACYDVRMCVHSQTSETDELIISFHNITGVGH